MDELPIGLLILMAFILSIWTWVRTGLLRHHIADMQTELTRLRKWIVKLDSEMTGDANDLGLGETGASSTTTDATDAVPPKTETTEPSSMKPAAAAPFSEPLPQNGAAVTPPRQPLPALSKPVQEQQSADLGRISSVTSAAAEAKLISRAEKPDSLMSGEEARRGGRPPSTPRTPPRPPDPARRPLRWADIEERLGTNWLNRVGITVLVIGAAFFLNYSMQYLGKGGKVALIYALSATLLGLGIHGERRRLTDLCRRPLSLYGSPP